MAPQQHEQDIPPPYSRRPSINERVLAIAPDFSLAIDAIQVVQETFPGTSVENAWEFIQRLARLVREDIRGRHSTTNPGEELNHSRAQRDPAETSLSSIVPEDSPMHDAA